MMDVDGAAPRDGASQKGNRKRKLVEAAHGGQESAQESPTAEVRVATPSRRRTSALRCCMRCRRVAWALWACVQERAQQANFPGERTVYPAAGPRRQPVVSPTPTC
jgi:hypothetical protein